ncbi:MAG TPA: head GIN domain-containing protein [Lacibacter sp.]|nr:head GIN domain-containing protein [Lacibacter sp.]
MKQIILLLLTSIILISCKKDMIRGSGPVVTRTLSIPAFSSVEAHYDIDAVITYGNIAEVKVTGYENLLNILETEIDNGVLKLKYNKQYNTIRNGNVRFEIIIPRIVKTGIYGSGDIKVKGFLAGSEFTAGIYGSGDIIVENSNYQSATLDIYGSGKIEAQGLQVKNALANIYGSGHSYISVSERLVSKIFGSGNVYYWGNPLLETTQNGSGRVIKR